MTNPQPDPSSQRIRRIILAFLAILLIMILFLLSPLSPLHYCTLMGCFDSLEITFSPLPPTQYTIMIVTDTGEVRRASCVPGQDSSKTISAYPSGPICKSDSVLFYDFAPKSASVQVVWQGGEVSFTAHPSYKSFHPNGAFCAPRCRQGHLQVEIP